MEQVFLSIVVVAFIAFVVWNGLLRAPLRPSVRNRINAPDGADKELEGLLEELRSGAQTGPVLRRLRQRVAEESSRRVQAMYLCAAGEVLRHTVSRRGTALRYFMQALKADPSCAEARQGLRDLLLAQRRGFRLEQLYWELLSRLDAETYGSDAVLEAWNELADLFARRRAGRVRARALRHLLLHAAALRDDQAEERPQKDAPPSEKLSEDS